MISSDLHVCAVSPTSKPAGKFPDSKMFLDEQLKQHMLEGLDDRDILASDGTYRSFRELHVRPHRKPRNGTLSKAKSRENDIFSEFRGDIERKFGDQVSKFNIVYEGFRHGEARFNREFKIVCALLNLELETNKDPDLETAAQNHPFFSFDTLPLNEIYGEEAALDSENEQDNSEEDLHANKFKARTFDADAELHENNDNDQDGSNNNDNAQDGNAGGKK